MPLLHYWGYLVKTVIFMIFRVYTLIDFIAPSDTMRVNTQEKGFLVISCSSFIPSSLVSEIYAFFWNMVFPFESWRQPSEMEIAYTVLRLSRTTLAFNEQLKWTFPLLDNKLFVHGFWKVC